MIDEICSRTAASIRLVCETLGYPRSSYYHAAEPTASQLGDREVGQLVEDIFHQHLRRYGYRRIYHELKARGTTCSAARVRRLMRERGLRALQPKSFKPATSDGRADAPSPNLAGGKPAPGRPAEVWAGDITYVPTSGGWVYMAVVIDLCTRKVLGWSVADNMRAGLVTDALAEAIAACGSAEDTIFHSDRGSQYGSRLFRSALASAGMKQSMSRRANPYDNAWTESFIGTYKNEMVQDGEFESESDVRNAAFDYFAGYYNTRRLHSAIGYKTPAAYERELLTQN